MDYEGEKGECVKMIIRSYIICIYSELKNNGTTANMPPFHNVQNLNVLLSRQIMKMTPLTRQRSHPCDKASTKLFKSDNKLSMKKRLNLCHIYLFITYIL